MGKNTKIICTVVPNGKDGNRYFFSVFLTPRLPDSGILKDYYEIQHWTDFIDFFRNNKSLKVKVNNLDGTGSSYSIDPNISKVLNSPIFDSSRLNNIKSKVGHKDIWSKLFRTNTPVKGWIINEGEHKTKITTLYKIEELKKHLKKPTQKEALENFLKGDISLEAFFATIEPKEKAQDVNFDNLLKELKLQFQDLGKLKMSEDEIKLRNKENQEFHKKISILADYPHLLRLTGWIHDFSITVEDNFSYGTGKKYNMIKLEGLSDFLGQTNDYSKWANFINEIDFKTPWTYFNADDFSIKYADLPNLKYFDIEKGYIKKSKASVYDITAQQFDIAQLSQKLEQSLSNQNLSDAERKSLSEIKLPKETDVISNGIGLKIKSKVLQSVIDNNPDIVNKSLLLKINIETDPQKPPIYVNKRNDELNIDDYILFGHNLDTGYWIDVKKGEEANFSSLCLRTADYAIDRSPYSDKNKLEFFIENFEDEPWVAESAQAGKSGNLYADEELCRWNNWSLTCPHIGNYPQDETTAKENHEFNDIELQNIKPYAKGQTLPTLRFGQQYSFRIKVVDICGNSPALKNNSWDSISNNTDFTIQSELYKRLEQVNPPNIHFAYPIYEIRKNKKTGEIKERNIHKGHEGEDLLTLVIKTKIINGESKFIKESERVVSPPKTSLHFVEVHGVLDSIFKKQYLDIYHKAGFVPKEPSLEYYKGQSKIPYLTDPAAKGFKLLLTENNKNESIEKWETQTQKYLDRIFYSILLTSSNNEERIIKPENNYRLKVLLKPGTISIGKVSTIVDEKPNSNLVSIFNTAYALEDGVYTNPIEIKFIHAVQKPIVRNDDNKTIFTGERYFIKAVIKDRTPVNDTDIQFDKIEFIGGGDKKDSIVCSDKFPVSTSGEFRLIANIKEIILDPNNEDGLIIYNKLFIKTFSNLNNENSLICEKDDKPLEFLSAFNSFSHSFGNTKHYNATYKIEAVSRFKDYFPDEKEFSVYGNLNPLIVKNSKKPDALIIDYINLVFSWEKKTSNEESRSQNKYKVFFKGDFYTTGENEKIAVLFLDRKDEVYDKDYDGTRKKGQPLVEEDKATIPDDCEGLVSEFGSDPTVYKDARTKGLQDSFFVNCKIVGNNNIENDIIDIRLFQRGDQRFSTPFETITKQYCVKAAVYDLLWDKELKKFYCEIEINQDSFDKRYTPFLKFAMCRYQEHSIKDIQTDKATGKVIEKSNYDFRFSNVVMSPQVQHLPTRTISKQNNEYTIDTGNISKKDYDQKSNEFWLILEPDNDNDFAAVVEGNNSNKIVFKTEKQNIVDGKIVIDKHKIKGYDSAYIEEFEYYEVDANKNFQMSESEIEIDGVKKYYNPRNDIRKRLVFTYKLNNL